MPDLIPHPDRPDEYLHAGQLVAQNRGTPVLEVVVDSRYAAGDGMAQSPVGVVSIAFDKDNADHMALYAAMRTIGLKAVQIMSDRLQEARDARLASQ